MPPSLDPHAQSGPFSSALACMLVLCLLAGCDKRNEAPAADPGPTVSGPRVVFKGRALGIRTQVVEPANSLTLVLPGRLVWDEDRTVRVFSPFAGRVVRSLVQHGDSVKAGQALAELASPDFGQARADARKAAADLALAQQSLRRVTELNKAGISADKDLQAAQADFSRATGEHERARLRLQQVSAGSGSGQNFILKAPIAGIVVDKSINPGQELRPDQPGLPLFVITDLSRLWLWMDAAEADLGRIASAKPGAALVVHSTAYPTRAFQGSLIKSADFIDPVARTVKLRGVVNNASRELKGEMFVTVDFPIAIAQTASAQFTVPSSAVLLEGDKHYVFVTENDQVFTRVGVEVVRVEPERTTIAGLTEGQKIVTEGNLYLQQLVVATAPPASGGAQVRAEAREVSKPIGAVNQAGTP